MGYEKALFIWIWRVFQNNLYEDIFTSKTSAEQSYTGQSIRLITKAICNKKKIQYEKRHNLLGIKNHLNMNCATSTELIIIVIESKPYQGKLGWWKPGVNNGGQISSAWQEISIVFWSISLAGVSNIRKSFWQGRNRNINVMLHFFLSQQTALGMGH